MTTDALRIVADPAWHAHRINAAMSEIYFVRIDREQHRAVTFLEDKYLSPDVERATLPFAAVEAAVASFDHAAPRFIFHSSMATSTLLTRIFDAPGASMSLAEPIILNELATLKRRRVDVRRALAVVLKLLGRPFAEGEKVVVKPGNTANILIPEIAAALPELRALVIEAPIRTYLRSDAKKGIFGRTVYRRLYALLSRDRDLKTGFTPEDVFEQTDLQIAAMAWLHHRCEFVEACRAFPAAFVTLDSAAFLAEKEATLHALSRHFDIALDVPAIMAGPIFKRHSKEIGRDFDERQRDVEHEQAQAAHGEEIDMVAQWLAAVATHVGLPETLPAALSLRSV
jgi:predicted nucleic acid-binding protein